MIALTPDEKYITNVIANACDLAPSKPTARITGGWVRDKILGVPSSDIDVMIDNMTGSEFAKYLGQDVKTAIVKENPDRSKHLEVAICSIPLPSGVNAKVEFVNARKEVYKKDSRIPTMKPATYIEDAFRRDLTINALFYNVKTGEIEDPTGKGMADLNNKIIRAPGDPKSRYFEDPLRVFRTIRFAARYRFNIEPETWKALCDPEIQHEVFEASGSDGIFKLARERIGQELIKMAEGKNPEQAFKLLYKSGILQKMLSESVKGSEYENNLNKFEMPQNNQHHDFDVWNHTERVIKNMSQRYSEDDPQRAMAIFSALFHDVGKLYNKTQQPRDDGFTSYLGHEDESSKISKMFMNHFVMQKYLSTKPDDDKSKGLIELVEKLTAMHMRPHGLTNAGKTAINRFLREIEQYGLNWMDVINMAYSDVMAKSDDPQKYSQDVSEIDNLKQTIQDVIENNKNLNVNLSKSILSGYEIMQLFNRKDSGPWIGEIQKFLKEKQLEGLSDKESAQKIVLEQFPQFINKTVTASTGSKIYFDKMWEKISDKIDTSPLESLSIAANMFNDSVEDENSFCYENAAKLYMKTGFLASMSMKKPMVDEKMYNAARKMSEERIYNPELVVLSVCIKSIKNNEISTDDVRKLKMAYNMDFATVQPYLDSFFSMLSEESQNLILSAINYPMTKDHQVLAMKLDCNQLDDES